MADLPGGPAAAVEQPVLEHDAGADAGGDLDEDRAVVAAGDAVAVLGQGAEVGVVVDVHVHAEPLARGVERVDADPAGEDGRGADHAVGHRRGQAQAEGADRGPVRAGRGEQLLQQVVGAVEALGVRVAGARGGGAPRRAGCRSCRRGRRPRGCGRSRCPATRPAERANATVVPRRPLPGSTSSRPPAASSRTMLDTVAGARPVCRAMSAWVTGSAGPLRPEHVDDALQVGRAQRGGRARRGHGGTVGQGNACRQDLDTKCGSHRSVTSLCSPLDD